MAANGLRPGDESTQRVSRTVTGGQTPLDHMDERYRLIETGLSRSERDAETYLRCTVLPRRRLQVLRTCLNRRNRPVWRIEDVEDLGNSLERHAMRQRH